MSDPELATLLLAACPDCHAPAGQPCRSDPLPGLQEVLDEFGMGPEDVNGVCWARVRAVLGSGN